MANLNPNKTLRRRLFWLAGAGLLAALAGGRFAPVTPAAHAQEAPAATFSNTTALTLNDADGGGPGVASTYPSTITTSGLSGTVTDVNVTLNGLTHTWPDDIAVLLVGPGGQNIVLQSDVGAGTDVSNITYTLDDQASSIMPDSGTLTSTSYRPTSVANDEEFPTFSATIAPPTTYSQSTPAGSSTLNGIFGGTTPNGVWRLYVVDQFSGDTGAISGGWTLAVTTSAGNAPSEAGSRQQEQAAEDNPQSAVRNPQSEAPTASFSSTTPITLTDATAYDSGSANPYPSTINVSGLSGTITDVNVTVRNVTHPVPDDIGLMLVGPDGRHVILQTDAGGAVALSNTTYTFDDSGATGIPNSGPIVNNTSYRPTSISDDDHFPPVTGIGTLPYKHSAPAGSSTLNGIFAGATPNGDWKLFAVDQFTGDSGIINGGWTLDITTSAPTAVMQFSSSAYTVSEGGNSVTITAARSGDTSVAATVDFATADGTALQRKDYTIASGTLSFAAGETSKTFTVLVTDNNYVDGSRTLTLALSNAGNGALGAIVSSVLTITDNDTATPTTNPADTASFFVRQHYYDFLSRVPDDSGLTYWTGQITACGSTQSCINTRRVGVSNAFFYEQEFQQTGAYVYRLYRAAYGNTQPLPNTDTTNTTEANKLPSYAVFAADRARVVGGTSLAQGQLALATAFVARTAFTTKYPTTLDAAGFVDAVLANISSSSGVSLTSQRASLISLFNSGGRAAVMYRLADESTTNPIVNSTFIDAEYNRAFVATQYFGYLRRDSDVTGYLFWLGQVNSAALRDVTKQNAMVCAFITATEYQQRFSSVVTHSNSECP